MISRRGGEISKWTTGDRPRYIPLRGVACDVPWAEALRKAKNARATPPRQRRTPIKALGWKKAN